MASGSYVSVTATAEMLLSGMRTANRRSSNRSLPAVSLRRCSSSAFRKRNSCAHGALDTAIATARMQIESLQDRFAAEADASRAEIFEAHQVLLDDPEVLERAAADRGDGWSHPEGTSDGELVLPPALAIARRLVEAWLAG